MSAIFDCQLICALILNKAFEIVSFDINIIFIKSVSVCLRIWFDYKSSLNYILCNVCHELRIHSEYCGTLVFPVSLNSVSSCFFFILEDVKWWIPCYNKRDWVWHVRSIVGPIQPLKCWWSDLLYHPTSILFHDFPLLILCNIFLRVIIRYQPQ